MFATHGLSRVTAQCRISLRIFCVVAPALLAVGCTPLKVFDALVSKDKGVVVVAQDVPYGPDLRQRIDVYRPRIAAQPLPVIVFFYGGSWNSGTKSGYSFLGRALASRGFLVAIPDYRLVPQVRYPTFLEDNAAAVRWIEDHASALGGDPDRLVLAGHSAGAYNAAMLTYDRRWLRSEQRRVRGFVGLAGPYDFLPFTDQISRATFNGASDLQSTQPVSFIEKGSPPAFLATGAKDSTVLPRNSDALAAHLIAAGSPVVRRTYPNLGHIGILTAIARPLRGRASVLDDMIAFARQVAR